MPLHEACSERQQSHQQAPQRPTTARQTLTKRHSLVAWLHLDAATSWCSIRGCGDTLAATSAPSLRRRAHLAPEKASMWAALPKSLHVHRGTAGWTLLCTASSLTTCCTKVPFAKHKAASTLVAQLAARQPAV